MIVIICMTARCWAYWFPGGGTHCGHADGSPLVFDDVRDRCSPSLVEQVRGFGGDVADLVDDQQPDPAESGELVLQPAGVAVAR